MIDWEKMGIDLSYFNLSRKEKIKKTIYLSPLLFLFFLYPAETTFFTIERNWFVGILFSYVFIQVAISFILLKKEESELRKKFSDTKKYTE